jgi:DNA repair exonuclease SbcCD ATPase subunit
MTKLALQRINIANLRSVLGAELSFPLHGLVGIKGVNRDTGGSSGSGKTSLLLGVTYALGYANFPATQLKTWLNEDPLQVALEILVDGAVVELKRGKTTSLTEGLEKPIKGATAVEKRLRELLGFSPDLLQALTYRPQGGRSAFLTMDDASKKDFLGTVIPLLERFEQEAESAQSKARDAATLAAQKAQLVSALDSQVALARGDVGDLVLRDLSDLRETWEELATIHNKTVAITEARRGALDVATGEWQKAQDALMAIKPPEVAGLETQLAEVAAELPPATPNRTHLEAQVRECAKRLVAVTARDEVRRQEHEARGRAILARVADAEKKISRKNLLLNRAQELDHALAHLRGQSCPTCHRAWDQANATLAETVAQRAAVEEELEACTAAENARDEALAESATAPVFAPDPMAVKLTELNTRLAGVLATARAQDQAARETWEAERAARVSALQTKIQATINAARTAAAEVVNAASAKKFAAQTALDNAVANSLSAERQAAAAASEFKMASVENEQRAIAHKAAIQRLDTLVERARLLRAEADEAQTIANAEADFAEMVGREGFLGAIFDEILAEIAQEANAILGRVPNTSRVVFRFRSETVTEKGRVKRSIAPVVAVDGHDEIPYTAALSGGMRSSFELSVDLAIIRVLSRRTSAAPGWLFLDEPFEGLGRVEKEAWVEILKDYAQDRLVFVVDHASETKELFDSMINVSFAGGVTTITQGA